MIRRMRARDFAGREFSLAEGIAHYEKLAANGPDLLLLGAGPGWEELPPAREASAQGAKIRILQSPSLAAGEKAAQALFCEAPEAAKFIKNSAAWFYKPAMRLDPEFWEKVLGALEAANAPGQTRKRLVWLPGDERRLMHQELRQALLECGHEVSEDDFSEAPQSFMRQEKLPELVLSVNFRGLDADGRIFNFCRARDIPVAAWLADNPWNIVSRFRLPWWKKAAIFTTDASFLPSLREEGARSVHFLPLAAAPHFFGARGDGAGAPIFVGRSEFPARRSFFAAARLPPQTLALARAEFERGGSPDFHWWRERLPGALWPGRDARNAAYGAEIFSREKRASWLRAGAGAGLEIYGDEGWRELAPELPLHAPVDYYGSLPGLYAGARAVINATSLLLPQSLSQRHFDVWAAGGFLLSDATRGLEIFPEELARPITVQEPAELAERLAHFSAKRELRRELGAAWREEIAARHLYAHRVEEIARILQKGAAS